jgi:hypothetical protein
MQKCLQGTSVSDIHRNVRKELVCLTYAEMSARY